MSDIVLSFQYAVVVYGIRSACVLTYVDCYDISDFPAVVTFNMSGAMQAFACRCVSFTSMDFFVCVRGYVAYRAFCRFLSSPTCKEFNYLYASSQFHHYIYVCCSHTNSRSVSRSQSISQRCPQQNLSNLVEYINNPLD